MLTIHHLNRSQSERALLIAEELGLTYDLKVYPRDPQTSLAPPVFKELSPAGTAPVMTDTSSTGQAITLYESGAIAQYLSAVHGGGKLELQPSDEGYPEYLQWLHYTNGTLQSMLGRYMIVGRIGGEEARDGPIGKWVVGKVHTALQNYEDRLGKVKWLAGEKFTLADCMSVFSLSTMRGFIPIDLSSYPNILRYLKDVGERPAYQRAMEKGDPDLKPMLDGKVELFSFQGPKK